MLYYRETATVKANSVADYIVESYFYKGADKRKILIFGHHQFLLDTIEMKLNRG